MRDACWDSSESLGSLVHCVHSVGKILSQKSGRVGSLETQLSQQAKAFLSPVTGSDKKESDMVRETERKKKGV